MVVDANVDEDDSPEGVGAGSQTRASQSGAAMDTAKINQALHSAISEFGRVDILVTCFDLSLPKATVEVTEQEFHQILASNLTTVFSCCKVVGEQMLKQHSGRIINIVSAVGVRASPSNSAYCAAKAAVLHLTRALSLEWSTEGVSVNAIAYGAMSDEWDEEVSTQVEIPVSYIPLRRRGQPSDLGGALVYLASDVAGYVTGQTFIVDGGLLGCR